LSKGIQQQKSMKYLEQLTNRAVEVAHKTWPRLHPKFLLTPTLTPQPC
jgi:hypothetical protein